MRIAVVSDELYPVNEFVAAELERRGHVVERFGSLKSQQEESWALATQEAARVVAQKACDEGVFFCWTGTGASIAANKVKGIRAALCTDAETARNARIWNHANVLVLSNRLLTQDLAREILDAWFSADPLDPKGKKGVSQLKEVEST